MTTDDDFLDAKIERIARALESIAQSLLLISHPAMVVASADPSVGGEPLRTEARAYADQPNL